jgi:signal peptidase I
MFKFIKFTLAAYLVIAAVASLVWLALWKTDGFKLYSVQTNSMAPVLQPGDLAVSVKANPSNLQIGDIISYHSGQAVITHRLYKTYPRKGYIVTKGDNLAQADPPIPYSAITGKTVRAIPKLGRALDFLRRPAGLIVLVYLPALFISAYELQRLAANYGSHSYKATARQ